MHISHAHFPAFLWVIGQTGTCRTIFIVLIPRCRKLTPSSRVVQWTENRYQTVFSSRSSTRYEQDTFKHMGKWYILPSNDCSTLLFCASSSYDLQVHTCICRRERNSTASNRLGPLQYTILADIPLLVQLEQQVPFKWGLCCAANYIAHFLIRDSYSVVKALDCRFINVF